MPTPTDADEPMIVLEIPGLYMSSQLIHGRLEPRKLLLCGKGAEKE